MATHLTPNWQIKLFNSATTVEGAGDIAQAIYIILTTIPGTDPLRPGFGCNLYQYLDRPMTASQGALVSEITDAIEKWEPRVNVRKCFLRFSAPDAKKLHIDVQMIRSAQSFQIQIPI